MLNIPPLFYTIYRLKTSSMSRTDTEHFSYSDKHNLYSGIAVLSYEDQTILITLLLLYLLRALKL